MPCCMNKPNKSASKAVVGITLIVVILQATVHNLRINNCYLIYSHINWINIIKKLNTDNETTEYWNCCLKMTQMSEWLSFSVDQQSN